MRRCPPRPPAQFSLLKQIPNTAGKEFLTQTWASDALRCVVRAVSVCVYVRESVSVCVCLCVDVCALCVRLGAIPWGLGCEEGHPVCWVGGGAKGVPGRFPAQGSGLALPASASAASVGLCGRPSPSLPLYSTLESASSKSYFGGNNETPVNP